jgi:DNA invertase Pin-like site-specific DNA recombinase
MNNLTVTSSKVTTSHRAKFAYVYVRQSSLGQVIKHQESTGLQYRLVERAVQLGWPRERVEVIDDDLGKSGASAEQRFGFQHLLAEIGLGKVGLVVSLDASRLARNNRDWYQLLELCSLFGALIADGEQLYDPRAYHDRLLLGLSGMMSEAELHQLKMRLQQGGRHKAERGELRLPLPAGLSYSRTGDVMLNPDEEIQERLRLVFQKFLELKSAKAVVRYFQQHNLSLPIRALRGPAPHEVEWRPASSTRIGRILKNPAYAGAYVYGQYTSDPTRRRPDHPRSGTVRVPIEEWGVCLRDAHPGYITWEEFMANQQQLLDNTNQFEKDRRGVPRNGTALLQGIVFCGICGRRMRVSYSGPKGEYPVYFCNADQSYEGRPRCQEVRAIQVDTQIEQLVLAAMAPDKMALALEAMAQMEDEFRALEQQWKLRLERMKYEAERARRQYHMVEPENRLVARQLELQWEEKLRQAEEIEQAYRHWSSEQRVEVTESDRAEILALGEDLPRLWRAPTTTAADRKQIVRFIIKDVALDQKREQGQIVMRVNWQTGATSEHCFRRKVGDYEEYAELERLRQRIRELNAEQKMDAEIAAQLNAEGFVTALGKPFQSFMVHALRNKWKIPTVKINGNDYNPERWPDGAYSVHGAAKALEIAPCTVFLWLRNGKLKGKQLAKGMPWKIKLTDKQIAKLKAQIRRVSQSNKEAS